ncbi:hypothetical protein MMC30_008038 [Trapelia coarctata]|nr:hypothetical protein [Trapelia coarctata]
MSRSAADATRFTATSPHAYSKPSSLRSAASNTFSPSSSPRSHPLPRKANASPSSPGPSGGPSATTETSAQKVARLRAAYDAQRNAQVSTWDKIVVRGRIVADVAHRITTLTLIGCTVIAGGVAVFSLGDMIIYNRRKRREFFAEQHMLLQEKLVEARAAAAKGIADEDQMLLINRERAAEEAEQARKAKKGVWNYITGVFSTEGLKQEDTVSGLDALSEGGLKKVGEGSLLIEPAGQTVTETATEKGETPGLGILQAVEEKRRDGERELQKKGVSGGPLDQLAEQAAAAGKSKGGWTSWMTSR